MYCLAFCQVIYYNKMMTMMMTMLHGWKDNSMLAKRLALSTHIYRQ